MKFLLSLRAKSRNLLLCLFLFATSVLSAQNTTLLDRFYEGVSQSCTDLSYTYSARISGVNNVGHGTLSAQGLMWTMKGNGVEMYCDSASLWVLDPALKEAVIEPAATDAQAQILTNPAVLFVRMKDVFNVRESRNTSDGDAVLYILQPKTSGDFDYFNVEISKSDASVRNGMIALKDGTLIKIEVSSMKLTPERPVEDFRPRTVFDSSWIVTDLR